MIASHRNRDTEAISGVAATQARSAAARISGGAPAFLEFLTKEFRPWGSAGYRVTDDSTLIGNSMGGLREPLVPELRDANTAELTRQLAAGRESRGYPSLRLTTRIFPEVTHFTMWPVLVAHGLRAVFEAERSA